MSSKEEVLKTIEYMEEKLDLLKSSIVDDSSDAENIVDELSKIMYHIQMEVKEKVQFWNTERKYAIIGLCRLLAVVSIIYSTVVIVQGVDDIIPKILIAPQAILAAIMAIKAFTIKEKK